MIPTLIIDDEADGRDALRMALTRYCPEVILLGDYGVPEEGLAAIRELKPKLVFLDVQMPGMSGFDLLQRAQPVSFEVIFVSAYDRYAIKAIRFSALDYLLKPVDVDELIRAIQRVNARKQVPTAHHLQSAGYNLPGRSGKIERVAVPSAAGIDVFETDEIIFCRAEGSYTQIYLRSGLTQLVSRNLKDFEELLSESGFCRVHHSFLINLRHVQRYLKGEGGQAIMTGGHHVDIARRKKESFLALLPHL